MKTPRNQLKAQIERQITERDRLREAISELEKKIKHCEQQIRDLSTEALNLTSEQPKAAPVS